MKTYFAITVCFLFNVTLIAPSRKALDMRNQLAPIPAEEQDARQYKSLNVSDGNPAAPLSHRGHHSIGLAHFGNHRQSCCHTLDPECRQRCVSVARFS